MSNMQLRDAMGQDLDDAVRENEVRNALDGIIGRLIDKHQDETLGDVSMILTNSLATTSKSIRRTLRNSSDDISTKINTEINSLRRNYGRCSKPCRGATREAHKNTHTTEEHIGQSSRCQHNNEKIESLETKSIPK